MSSNKAIETKTANIFIEDDIVYLIYKKNTDIGLNQIEENLSAKTCLQNSKPMKTLVDIRSVWQYSEEAREVVSSERFKKITIAMAVIVGYSLPIKMVANFFMKINKQETR